MKPVLTEELLCKEAKKFALKESKHDEPSLYGVSDGKAVGTYLEHKFQARLCEMYTHTEGNAAKGIDCPILEVDIKVTSIKQPQSSCPFKSPEQKIFGIGYSLLVFVYDKKDDSKNKTSRLKMLHTIFIKKHRTADYQMTTGLRRILENNGNTDDIAAFLLDMNLLIDDIQANKLAEKIMKRQPEIGYLTISNAYQWRLQYKRTIKEAGVVEGIIRVL